MTPAKLRNRNLLRRRGSAKKRRMMWLLNNLWLACFSPVGMTFTTDPLTKTPRP